ncbi:hypothetical protein [Microtetraspora glauca]|uniref:Uncharacterized protein n=1 Tax=Microtetraspora glauca TaxID=1996 RepID=A0ABV3GHD1_MICGL
MILHETETPEPVRIRDGVRVAPGETDLPPPFHGVHVAPLQRERDEIHWLQPTPRCTRVRVHEHTCECKATIYELCQAGGLTFIRRTVRGPDGPVVHEGPWLIAAKAERLWQHLLLGQAR